ncbi:hypothetical protein BC835DRAFT_453728 [Cytidiella melzeri]|nr:hypothetical protein BC835DRAFT_453728 [Cytidiella melzeri]
MSRPDGHAADYDYSLFDSRDFSHNTQGLPGHGLYHTADMPRDFWSRREPPSRDHTNNRDNNNPPAFYHTPTPSMSAAHVASQPANGVSNVAPRMFSMGTAAQSMGISGGPGEREGWIPASVMKGTATSGTSPAGAGSGMPTTALNNAASTGGVTQNNAVSVANRHPHAVSSVTQPGAVTSSQLQPSSQQNLVLNRHHRASPPRPFSSNPPPPPFNERDRDTLRDAYFARQLQQQTSSPPSVPVANPQPPSLPSPTSASVPPRSTLWWGELEPWMDEEYAKQVCNLMGWDPVNIKVPRPNPDPMTGRQANNPGYCFLTFPSNMHAASVLSQVNTSGTNAVTMPNSSKPFTMNWASSVPTAPIPVPFSGPTISIPGAQNPQYPKEYSIFVGDLAPEVSNSDLVAVFRNPVLGLRNDREPRFIRPFLSCKSAKIMLDPVTGVSRGYGFVRFTDESDQQRALIEMHGLYCLSRPMRISPATAKFKPVPGMTGLDFSQMPFSQMMPQMSGMTEQQTQQPPQPAAVPMPNPNKSVSAPLATASGSNNSLSSAGCSAPSLSATSSVTSSSTLASAPSDDILKSVSVSTSASSNSAGMGSNSSVPTSISSGLAQQTQEQLMAQRYNIPEESWKHHAQARAILSNLIGPNGEQLTSSDPYNTTVFVGGLSPLISEETLRTFFAPFGDIHYVKVPVGKHCGFVQFVRKPDAERAIQKMQGFPIGGSRIRLSWGRSQYKAAQAAAQAAQTAALQAQTQYQLLEKFGITQFLNNNATNLDGGNTNDEIGESNVHGDLNGNSQANYEGALHAGPTAAEQAALDAFVQHQFDAFGPSTFDHQHPGVQFNGSGFSPFSPDPTYMPESIQNREGASMNTGPSQSYPSSTKGYAPWYSSSQQEEKVTVSSAGASGKISPTSAHASRPASARAFGSYLSEQNSPFPPPNRASSRGEGLIARPELSRKASHPLPMPSHDHFGSQDKRDNGIFHDLNGTFASLHLSDHGMSWTNNEGASATSS